MKMNHLGFSSVNNNDHAATVRAIQELSKATGGTFDFYRLNGPRNRSSRRRILSALGAPAGNDGCTRLRDLMHGAVCFAAGIRSYETKELTACAARTSQMFADYCKMALDA